MSLNISIVSGSKDQSLISLAVSSSSISPNIFLNFCVCLEGLVLPVASPGAGLYADGSSSLLAAPFLKCASLADLVDFAKPE